MAPSATRVRQTLGGLLPTLDLNTATERTIRDKVAEKLGAPVDEHKKLIKDEIDAFLTRLAASQDAEPAEEENAADAAADDDDDSDFDMGDEDTGAAKATGKRKAPAAKANTQKRPAKQAKSAPATAAAQGGSWHLGTKGQKYARVEEFRGVTRVDLRECYSGDDGELKPGKKGIALQPEEWAVLAGGMQQWLEAARGNDADYVLQLSEMRRATVGEFRGNVLVQVREYYSTPDGAQQPGKKGIALTLEQLEALADAAPAITAALPGGATGADATGTAAAPAAASAAPKATAAAAKKAGAAGKAKKGETAAAGAAEAADGAAAGPSTASASRAAGKQQASKQEAQQPQQQEQGGADWVDLGGGKRGSISEFKGKHYVDLREWYQKKDSSGAWAPGQKGIALPAEEWGLLCEQAGAISAAALAEDESVKVQLRGAQRQAYVNTFKGKAFVHVREMYEKDGKMLPGKKGVALTPDTWKMLVAAMPRLTQQLKAASG